MSFAYPIGSIPQIPEINFDLPYLESMVNPEKVEFVCEGDPTDSRTTMAPFLTHSGNSVFALGNDHGEMLPLLTQLETSQGFSGIKLMKEEAQHHAVVMDMHFDDKSPRFYTDMVDQPRELNASWISYYLETTNTTGIQIANLMPKLFTVSRNITCGGNRPAEALKWHEYCPSNSNIHFFSLDIDFFNFESEAYSDPALRQLIHNIISRTQVFAIHTSPGYRHDINLMELIPTIYNDWKNLKAG